jgi:hypothetical protein
MVEFSNALPLPSFQVFHASGYSMHILKLGAMKLAGNLFILLPHNDNLFTFNNDTNQLFGNCPRPLFMLNVGCHAFSPIHVPIDYHNNSFKAQCASSNASSSSSSSPNKPSTTQIWHKCSTGISQSSGKAAKYKKHVFVGPSNRS